MPSLALLYDLTPVQHIALGFILIWYPCCCSNEAKLLQLQAVCDNRSNTVVLIDGAVKVVLKKQSEDCEAIFNVHLCCQLLHRLIGHGLFKSHTRKAEIRR